ncbi:hypothetical protein BH23GEM3_BH23GEM3_05240 [soil metagenome]
MSTVISHEEAQEILAAAALGALGIEERALLEAHLHECRGCARLLQEYHEAVASLAELVPGRPMDPVRSARMRARILARARADKSGDSPDGQTTSVPATLPFRQTASQSGRWAGWMVAAGMAGLLFTHHAFHQPLHFGWIAAALFALALSAVGMYTFALRDRVASLQHRIARLDRTVEEREEVPWEDPAEPG